MRLHGARSRLILLGALALLACEPPTEPPPEGLTGFFVDVTEELGLVYAQSTRRPADPCPTGPGDVHCESARFTGGAAFGDVDGDGRVDLFVTRLGAHDLLFVQRSDGSFEERSAAWGLAELTADTNGAALFDADADGDLDLYVTGLGPADAAPPNDRYHFFENTGATFVEDAEARGLALADAGVHGGTSVAVGDYDADGAPDLFVTEWRGSDDASLFGPPHEHLLRNLGDGRFEQRTLDAGVLLSSEQCRLEGGPCRARSFSATFADLDRDGAIDLAVASDFGRSRLFFGRGDGTFEDATEAAAVGTDENGMGSTFGDYDGDGDLDWFVTSIADDIGRCENLGCGWGASGNRLYRNDGARRFTDVTDATGVRDGGWGWGAVWLDFDNDGDLDLAMTNGVNFPTLSPDTPFHSDPMRLWLNEGPGPMREVALEAGLVADGEGRGLCVLDVEGDGDLDVFIAQHGADGGRFFRNERGDDNAWLRVRVAEPSLGAEVTITVDGVLQHRTVGVGGHFLCNPEPVAHFGLGRGVRTVDAIEVRWLHGSTRRLEDVSSNAEVSVER